MKRIAVLGSTGSIGTQTLDVVRQHPDKLKVTVLVANTSADALQSQAAEFSVSHVALMDEAAANSAGLPGGLQAVTDLATHPEVDLVVVSVAGVIGLKPTIAAIQAGKQIALASKEVLVAAGEIVMPLVQHHKTVLTPIDSEHSALFQCLQGYSPNQVDELWLTASGGPFRGKTRTDLENVTVDQALNHPTWNMGGKITIDSATLMNKGLEIIEAAWLFGVPEGKINVVVHPQSVVHSMVKFKDTSVIGQLGWPNMRLPIQYALLYPERPANQLPAWNPVETPNLTFETPDETTFPALRIARSAMRRGGSAPAAFNAANERAVAHFLNGRCGFLQIADTVQQVLDKHNSTDTVTLDEIVATDAWARETTDVVLGLG